ncbi:hypothetical protein ACHAXR_013538 [Thalassiosira sp. AJA248-18]
MMSYAAVLLAVAATIYPSSAFYSGRPSKLIRLSNDCPLRAADDASVITADDASVITPISKPCLDPNIAAQFTIQVCTSTSCTRKLNQQGLDQYHVLGEVYAQAQAANMEKCMIIEDGGCQGGKNCKMGPCVAILHEDFDGNVALEGMNSNEFRERVFHNVVTNDDAARIWDCMENAISLMAEEEEDESHDEIIDEDSQ